jgi:proteic killer suppression protein
MLELETKRKGISLKPLSNRLEKLHGDRKGQHSIRINDQWRLCFVWRDGHAYDVEIMDYH